MIAMMVVSGMSFSSYAATPSKGTVYVNVTQDYAKAQKMLTLINKQRTKKGLRKLTLDKSLTTAAVQRAAEISMVIPTTSPHRRPDGRYAKTAHKLATRENCAEGTYSGPSAVVNTWMHSKGHKATILLKSARSCGIAYVKNPADEDVGYYVLIVSNSKAKKVEKSKKTVSSTKKVVALAKYLKKKYFFPEVWNNRTTLGIGDTTPITTYYFGPKTMDFTSPIIAPKSFNWTSSDKSVVTVDSKGSVTAVGPGKATVKAKLKKGPSITLSTTFTVETPEYYFDKLTALMTDDDIWYGEGYGYEDGDAYVKGIYSGRVIYDSYDDPETGEEVNVSYKHKGDYVVVQDSKVGEEIAFLCRYARYEYDEIKYQSRLYMIVSKNGDKLDDTVTFIHDYFDEDDNCLYKLRATAERGSIDGENLQWEVVQNDSGMEIDYENIVDQMDYLFIASAFNYLYGRTGIKFKYLGINRI